MAYQPEPIDISNVSLPEELMPLCDILARNTHEIWAQRRIADGWRLGSTRNDIDKTTPNIVPYDKLPADEKIYDQLIVTAALKTMISLGYEIRKTN